MLYNLFLALILFSHILMFSYNKEDTVEFKRLANKNKKSERS